MVKKKTTFNYPNVELGDEKLTINNQIALENQQVQRELSKYRAGSNKFVDEQFKLQWGRKLGESNQEFRLRNVNNFENDQVTLKVRNFANGDVVDNEVKLIEYVHDETPKKNKKAEIFCIDSERHKFIEGGAEPDDIQQGEAGDCWFLSSLCSFANYTNDGVQPLLRLLKLKKLIADDIDDLAQVEDSVFERAKSLLKGEDLKNFVDLVEKYDLFKNVAQRK